jgi:hypothetical protein
LCANSTAQGPITKLTITTIIQLFIYLHAYLTAQQSILKQAQANKKTNTYTQRRQKVKQGNLSHLDNNKNSIRAVMPNIMQ